MENIYKQAVVRLDIFDQEHHKCNKVGRKSPESTTVSPMQ